MYSMIFAECFFDTTLLSLSNDIRLNSQFPAEKFPSFGNRIIIAILFVTLTRTDHEEKNPISNLLAVKEYYAV